MKNKTLHIRFLMFSGIFALAMLGSCKNDSYGHDKDALHEKGDENLKKQQDTLPQNDVLDTSDLQDRGTGR